MDKETWLSLIKDLRDFTVTSSDQKLVHVRPRALGARPDLVLPLYFDSKFYALVGVALQKPTAFLREETFVQEELARAEIGRTARYIAVGLLASNNIEVPATHSDKMVVTVLFPHTAEAKIKSGLSDADGIVLSYHLDADKRTQQEKSKKILDFARARRGRR